MSALRHLIRPTIFTIGVCGTCFCGAAIVQYENRKRPYVFTSRDWFIAGYRKESTRINDKFENLKRRFREWRRQTSTGHQLACGTILINILVFCGWRIKSLNPILSKYFLSCATPPKILLSPMILSAFSHSAPLHLAFNMYALYSFSNIAVALMGPEQLVGFFVSAAAASSLTSLAYRFLIGGTAASLGASGALLALVAYVCVIRPNDELLIFFLPMTASKAITTIMVFDLIGLVARWKTLDHAAHLGGALFGIWYATYGQKLFVKYRKPVVDEWVKLKESGS